MFRNSEHFPPKFAINIQLKIFRKANYFQNTKEESICVHYAIHHPVTTKQKKYNFL